MIAFIYPITAIKPFLSNKGHSAEDVENMYQAWFKSITPSDALVCPNKMHISNLEVLMEFVGVSSFLVSIKCCRAGDGIFAALLVLASRLLSIKSLSSTMLSQRCLTFVPEVIYR